MESFRVEVAPSGLAAVRAAGAGLARAEFVVWSSILDHADACTVESVEVSGEEHRIFRAATILDLAQALRISEYAVQLIERDARLCRRRLPQLWESFAAGEVDARRVETVMRMLQPDSCDDFVTFLQTRAPEYAASHTVAELRTWLRRWEARLDPRRTAARAESARERRHLRFSHVDDAMSWIEAYLPTPASLAIEGRLTRAARALPGIDPDSGEADHRTLEQKRADLAISWLTTVEGSGSQARAEVAVVIEASDLFGWTDGPATVAGLGTPIPAAWVRDMLQSTDTTLVRLLTDTRGQVLDVSQIRYRPSAALRHALQWRDHQCRVTGCTRPAVATDLDHDIPFHLGGPTTADNLHSLCRRHHRIKSHGRLQHRHQRGPWTWTERIEITSRDAPIEIDVLHLKHPTRC